MKKRFVKKTVYLLVVVLVSLFVGCGEKMENESVVNNSIALQEDSVNFIEEAIDVPFEFTSFELERITEDSIGLVTNSDGRVEWYTITRSVKKNFYDKARIYINQEKTLKADWLEYRIWRYTLEDEKSWKREEVEKERGVEDESLEYAGATAFYGADDKLYLILQFALGVRVVVTRHPRWYDNTRGDVYEL